MKMEKLVLRKKNLNEQLVHMVLEDRLYHLKLASVEGRSLTMGLGKLMNLRN